MEEMLDSNGDNWIEYVFSKKYSIKVADQSIEDIFADAIRFGYPERFLADLIFQLLINGYKPAEKILEEAKMRLPDQSFEKIPDFVEADRIALEKGANPEEIFEKRKRGMHQLFVAGPGANASVALTKRVPILRKFYPCNFVTTKDGKVAGEIHCIIGVDDETRVWLYDINGIKVYALEEDLRLMTPDEERDFRRKRKLW